MQLVLPSDTVCVKQMQQQLESQQAQHATQLEDMGSRAGQLESLLQQATDLGQQHLAQLRACESELGQARQVRLAAITAEEHTSSTKRPAVYMSYLLFSDTGGSLISLGIDFPCFIGQEH